MPRESYIVKEQAVLSADPATPATNRSVIYPKSDGEWYTRNADGTIKQVTNASGSTAAVQRSRTVFTATAGQTSFVVPTYTIGNGLVDVEYNGSNLAPAEFTETDSTHVTLAVGATVGAVVVIKTYELAGSAAAGVSEGFVISMAVAMG